MVKEGYTVVSVVASCSLMLKKEWPHIMPDNEDVKLLSQNTLDISEYVVKMANDEVRIFKYSIFFETYKII